MSDYYNPHRTRNLYKSGDEKPYKLSRSKIDLFVECPRCFYIDRKLGVGRPPGFPFNLNSAVDSLLKTEFDSYRARGTRHPLMEQYGVEAVPYAHPDLDKWRHNFTGVQYLHESTNLLIHGAIDDVWQNPDGELIVVDYKSTSKSEEITALDKDWQSGYKRQMEIYQWLLRHNGFKVSDTGYFLYCNGRAGSEAFNARLEFDLTLIPYTGIDTWIEDVILNIYGCLNSDSIPERSPHCDYCAYIDAVNGVSGD